MLRPNFMDKTILYWNAEEVAAYVKLRDGQGVAPGTVRNWAMKKKIKARKAPVNRYDRVSVERFAAAHV